ncbi:two-component system, NtrC family, sensor histidine kinase HydH [Mariprofundus micogutta]|uniref:histidine kinase n=1 Tax=Mariprofundus micogutta TaxID=1921010 RepID=A0A1L8CK03_9PROT|nr:response regulator [Mariprofundus micogutta]GAV19221.1 two-component system, NtrC family, sensor histidine kinase HydH [Mariprofundus micogutta]
MLQRLPLTLKLLIVTILAALVIGVVLDSYHNRQLYKLYENEMLDTLKQQARIERLRFDRQVKFFMQITRISASHPPLIRQLRNGTPSEINKNVRRKPNWFPGRSLVGNQVHPRLVLLLNRDGSIHNSFSTQIETLPVSLVPPSDYYRTNSNGQSMLSMVDSQPWMLATSEVYENNTLLGFVMLGTPLDSELLSNAHRYDVDPNITALVDIKGELPTILASSNPDVIPAGMPLSEIKKSFLVTGQEFFDYGASDLPLHFTSFRSSDTINKKLNVVLDVAYQQRILQSFGLALVFILAIGWLAYRMRLLSAEVNNFAKKHLGVEIETSSVDSLNRLEHDIHLLEEKVIEVHKQEMEREKAEKWKARQQLRISEMRLYEFFDQAEELIQSVAPDGTIRYVNQRWLDELGYERSELEKLKISSIIAPANLKQHFKRMEQLSYGNSPGLFESCFITKTGKLIEVEGTAHSHFEDGELIEVHSIYRNISERKRLEQEKKEQQEQLEHTQRLESLGVLAGGIAHDFNNLLTTILGNASIVASKLPEQNSEQSHMQRVIESTERGADLCKQMLAYAGKGRFVIKPVNLSVLMADITKLLSVSISKHVELQYHLNSKLPNINADVSQIQQVMMNLVINASEAIGDQTGEIRVSTGIVEADTELLNDYLGENPEPGSYVWIEVSDTGCGMDAETQQKIFDPFFTTKFSGRGLGMSAMLGIIKAHHGALKLTSLVGKGSTFRVLFPVSEENLTTEDMAETDTSEHAHPGKTVLIIDDEAAIREIAAVLLDEQGITTLEAEDGDDGLKQFNRYRDKIDMILLDLTMPKMSGEECCKEIRKLDKAIPIIIASGYSKEVISPRFMEDEISAFLQKPYAPEILLNTVDMVLGQN